MRVNSFRNAALYLQQKLLYEVQAEGCQTHLGDTLSCCATSFNPKSLTSPPVKIPFSARGGPQFTWTRFISAIPCMLSKCSQTTCGNKECIFSAFWKSCRGDFSGKVPLPKGSWTFWKAVKLNIAASRFLSILLNTYRLPRQLSPSEPHSSFCYRQWANLLHPLN